MPHPRYRLRLALLMIAILAGAGAQSMAPHHSERMAHTSPEKQLNGPVQTPAKGGQHS